MPLRDRVDRDAVEDVGCRLQELHGSQRRAHDEVFGERKQQPVRFLVDFGQGARGVRKECESLPALAACKLPRQIEKAAALQLLDVGEEAWPLLQVRAGVRPAT